MRGNSFSHGESIGSGPRTPYWAAFRQGWNIRPVTHYDFTNGRLPV